MSIDQRQFKIWHDQYRARLLNNMTGVLRNRDMAEEVTAAALATAFEKRDQFRGEASFGTWVETIARNEARCHLGRNRTVSLESFDGFEPKEWGQCDIVADAPERLESCARLRKALRQIPAIYRRVLADHFIHGYSTKQISRRYRIPVGTVLSRIFTAKRLLRAAWEV